MPTLKGLRRRGYTPAILNAFCRDIGVTRNFNHVQYERLAQAARNNLHDTSPRVMGVLRPLKIALTWPADVVAAVSAPGCAVTIPDFPFDPSRGSHEIRMESCVFIDESDFRMEDSADYYGLAPGKVVGLKYAFRIRCESVEMDATTGKPCLLHCNVVSDDSDRPQDKAKTSIQWVPCSSAVAIEARLYNHLFVVEEPTEAGWEAELNPESEVVMRTALLDPSIKKWNPKPETHFQFERIGFFVVDNDFLEPKRVAANEGCASTADDAADGRMVFNLTVGLKDSKPAAPASASTGSAGAVSSGGVSRSRKDEQAKQLAEKMVSYKVV
jgi:glutaminyl-tRNA synthetase